MRCENCGSTEFALVWYITDILNTEGNVVYAGENPVEPDEIRCVDCNASPSPELRRQILKLYEEAEVC